jgi:hypothetical protein
MAGLVPASHVLLLFVLWMKRSIGRCPIPMQDKQAAQ